MKLGKGTKNDAFLIMIADRGTREVHRDQPCQEGAEGRGQRRGDRCRAHIGGRGWG
jgi:hypothetical protein